MCEEVSGKEECSEWINKIDEWIEAQPRTRHRTRYVFPSFSQSLDLDLSFVDYEFQGLEEDQHMTYIKCMDKIKQYHRDQGRTVSEGYYRVPNTPSQDQDFLDIAWKPGWSDVYYDWKDRWLGSIKVE